LPEIVLLGFIRIVTQARIVANPLSAIMAVRTVRYWLDQPNVRLLTGSPKSFAAALDLMAKSGVAGNLSTDAIIAALAQIHSAKLATVDTDFQRFLPLKTFNPLRIK